LLFRFTTIFLIYVLNKVSFTNYGVSNTKFSPLFTTIKLYIQQFFGTSISMRQTIENISATRVYQMVPHGRKSVGSLHEAWKHRIDGDWHVPGRNPVDYVLSMCVHGRLDRS